MRDSPSGLKGKMRKLLNANIVKKKLTFQIWETALKSHMNGKKRKERSPSNSTACVSFPPSKSQSDSSEKESCTKNQGALDTLLTICSTIQAEIRWILNIVCSKYSMSSSSDSGHLFASMFPDSNIAKSFQCGRTKASYVAHFGLVPFFHEQLL